MNKKFKKDYLTSNEQLEVMILIALKDVIGKMVTSWSERKAFYDDESKNLKTSFTYLGKFLDSIYSRLDDKELERLNRKLSMNAVRLYDNYEIEKKENKIKNVYSKFTLTSSEWYEFCEEIMNVRCKDCENCWQNCNLYKLLDENNAPEPTGFSNVKCKYFYTLDKGEDNKC